MSARGAGAARPCNIADARARLRDAEAFLQAAAALVDPDVVATNAIHAAIAASDAICCTELGQRSSDASHAAAVRMIGWVDKELGSALGRCLDRKTQAAYESRDVSTSDAATVVRQATRLVDAARTRVLAV